MGAHGPDPEECLPTGVEDCPVTTVAAYSVLYDGDSLVPVGAEMIIGGRPDLLPRTAGSVEKCPPTDVKGQSVAICGAFSVLLYEEFPLVDDVGLAVE